MFISIKLNKEIKLETYVKNRKNRLKLNDYGFCVMEELTQQKD